VRDITLDFHGRDWLGDDPEYLLVRQWSISVIYYRIGADDETGEEVIGNARASTLSLDDTYVSRGVGVLEALDAVSGELESLSEIYDDDEGWWSEDLGLADAGPAALLVETIELKNEYRGHGLGPVVLTGIIDRLGAGCSFVALEPQPIGDPHSGRSVDEAVRALERCWQAVGFEPFRNGVWTLDLSTTTFQQKRHELLGRTT
jgi:GNAT superfamily N-acetyltransferase